MRGRDRWAAAPTTQTRLQATGGYNESNQPNIGYDVDITNQITQMISRVLSLSHSRHATHAHAHAHAHAQTHTKESCDFNVPASDQSGPTYERLF